MHDVIVVGAGPAGLSAARTAARLGFRTLVLDRLHHAGHAAHPYSAVISPVPGFVSGRRLLDGLFFPALDLLIPGSLVIGFPRIQRFISPGGYEYRADLGASSDFPSAVIDKPGLLRQLASQAASAGAELRFGSLVTGLVEEDGRIAGVRAAGEVIRAKIVIAAEGASRRLTQQMGFYGDAQPYGYSLLVGYDLDAPGVGEDDPGQVVTFGACYAAAPRCMGMVVIPKAGAASVFLTLYSEGPHAIPERMGWLYLDEYTQRDGRVRELLRHSKVVGRWHREVALWRTPARVIGKGVVGVGDSITPGGHFGVLPSIFAGRHAALAVAEAIEGGEAGIAGLSGYQAMMEGSILPNLAAESKLLACLTHMDGSELDRLGLALAGIPVHTPFFSNWRTLTWEMMSWVVQQLPGMVQDWRSMEQAMLGRSAELQI